MQIPSYYFVELIHEENKLTKVTICKIKDNTELKFSSSKHLYINLDDELDDKTYWLKIDDFFNNYDERLLSFKDFIQNKEKE